MGLKRAARRRAAKLQPKDVEDTLTLEAITAKPDDWAALRREGLRMAEEHHRPGRHVTHHGRRVTVKILGSREVRAGDAVQMFDSQNRARLEDGYQVKNLGSGK